MMRNRTDWRTHVIRKLPLVGWRDEKLAQRVEQVARLRAQNARWEKGSRRDQRRIESLMRRVEELELMLQREGLHWSPPTTPSLGRHLVGLRRKGGVLSKIDPERKHPMRQVPFKLRNYRLAKSHGIEVPVIHDVWTDADDINFGRMPDKFVLKSDTGAGGQGVLPLERAGVDAYRFVGSDTILTPEDIKARFKRHRGIGAPFFAEGFIAPLPASADALPHDVKVYTCYGEVAQVLLMRRDPRWGAAPVVRSRYLDADGDCLGGDVAPRANIDINIPVPENLDKLLETAKHLSRVVGLKFSRIDLYSVDGRVVVGEITRSPGGAQWYRRDHDVAMGAVLDRAERNLQMDLIAGRPIGVLHGMHFSPSLYPAGHASKRQDAGSWEVRREACGVWC